MIVPCNAHQDRTIKHENGFLVGLPKKYQPAKFSYETRRLTIGDNTVKIPDPIWVLLDISENEKIRFSASWYHRQTTYPDGSKALPPYMFIRTSSCEFLINLDTLETIKFLRDERITENMLAEWKVEKTMPIRLTQVDDYA
jgi:hypothetical protein